MKYQICCLECYATCSMIKSMSIILSTEGYTHLLWMLLLPEEGIIIYYHPRVFLLDISNLWLRVYLLHNKGCTKGLLTYLYWFATHMAGTKPISLASFKGLVASVWLFNSNL